jgi:predicted DNA-binding transcriptional regulator YafY
MRADRLISLMLLLQRSGPVTGTGIAEELEVSLRTVYRDINALQRVGIPVAAVSGPHGGYSLIEGYWNDFARLTADETNAILAAASSDPLADIGLSSPLRRALEKLAAQRSSAQQAPRTTQLDPERIMIDHSGWDDRPSGGFLPTLARCIAQNRGVTVTTTETGPVTMSKSFDADPLGLVLKEGAWYLICRSTRTVVLGVDSIASVSVRDQRFAPPQGFSLGRFWSEWCERESVFRTHYRVKLRVPGRIGNAALRYLAGASAVLLLQPFPGPERPEHEWAILEMGFLSYQDARARIMGLGGAAQVIAPRELAIGIADYAEQILRAAPCDSEMKARPASSGAGRE